MNPLFLAIPLISALIGYVTNWVAIRMLFRPHEEKRLWGVRLPFTPGLIPRRRAELARSIGRSVRRYLLTHEAVGARLRSPAVRAHVDGLIAELGARWLERELPSPRALMPAELRPEWANWRAQLHDRLDGWLARLLARPELERLVHEQAASRLRAWLDEPLERLLPPELLDDLPERLGSALGRLLESEELERRLADLLARGLDRAVAEDRTLAELVPAQLREVLYEKLEDAVPYLLDRLVKVLEDDQVRKRIKIQLFEMVDELLQKTFKEDSIWDQFKLGLMESLVISPEEIKARIEDGIDQAGPRIAELVRREEVREKVYRALVDAVDRFLRRKLSEFRPEEETLAQVKGRLAGWIASLLRSEALHRQLVALVAGQLERHRGKSLRQLVPTLSEEVLDRGVGRLSDHLVRWLRSPEVRARAVAFIEAQVDGFLDRPLGRLDRFLPADVLDRARALAAERLLDLLERETPRILESLDLEALVEEQVSAFSLAEVERLVIGITGNQLRAITWFGAVLGFVIGLVQLALLALR